MLKMEMNMGDMTAMSLVFNGSDASIQQMGQAVPVDENQKKDLTLESAIISETAIKDLGLATELKGIESIEGTNAYAVEVTQPSGSKITYFYNIETGLKMRESETVPGPQGEMTQDTDWTDYKEVEGVKFPYAKSLPLGPMKMNATATSIEVNTGMEDSEFAIQ